MNSKKFSKVLVAIITTLFLVNVVLYFGWVDRYRLNFSGNDTSYGHGDLPKLGSIVWSNSLTEQKEYKHKHLELDEYLERINNGEDIKVDILTIGDSFSNNGGGVYFQDYLVSKYNLTVLNVHGGRIKNLEALGIVEVLRNNGLLAKIAPKVVIVESVERFLFLRYDAANYITNVPTINETVFIENFIQNKDKQEIKKEPEKIFPGYMVKRNIDYFIKHNVSLAGLNKKAFTAVGKENELLYLTGDFTMTKVNPDVEQTAKNIQTVADNLKAMGIELVFLPCPDKSSVYYPFLQSDGREYAAKPELDELLAVKRDYYMVDAKHILQQAVADGAVDVYWADDTHWSWRGFEIVVDEMMKNINIVK